MSSQQHLVDRVLELELATREQIDEALEICNQLSAMGMKSRSVIDVLHEKEYIGKEDFDRLRREAKRVEGKEQIAGYRLLDRLGEGAMGAVYRAKQLSLDREVAVKVLDPELASNEAYVKRFMSEARAVARLNHTNIISGIDVGDADGIKYLVMEYADGMTVSSLLERGGALDEERALWVVLQMARALDHAHRNNLVHRDVKPDNIIITKDGVAKLCDLGLARLESAEGEAPQRMGTPAYISPEQARGDVSVDERTDLYSLGATWFHMVTGRPPYTGKDAGAVLAKHLTEPVPHVRTIDPTISETSDGLVFDLLQKRRADRVESASALIPRLEAAIRDLQLARGASPSSAMGVAAKAKPAAGSIKVPVRPSPGPSEGPRSPAPRPSGPVAPRPRRRRRR